MSKINVAQYLRMSTDHQKYSLDNQAQFIQKYANDHNMEIIHSYDDSGKSGVTTGGRNAFLKLIDDITKKIIIIDTILVYDISRFGRFPSMDQFGYYTHLLQMNNVNIIYCANPVSEVDSDIADIQLFFGRKEASTHSKNLSQKVFLGQINLIKKGFHQGGLAGYGLRRMLVDENLNHKGILSHKEWKSIQTDRVILIPGPENEINIVKEIYFMFICEGKPERVIFSELNRRGVFAENNLKWTKGKVHQVLTNEKYIGHSVYNKTSFKLKRKYVKNPEQDWIRCDNAYEPIVSLEQFAQAQNIIQNRSKFLSDDDLLYKLRNLLKVRGKLSGIIIDEDDDTPSSSVYSSRFGGLIRAYQLIDYKPSHDYKYLKLNVLLREKYSQTIISLVESITKQGCYVDYDEETKLFTINDELKICLIIARCKCHSARKRWTIRLERKYAYDICITIRLDISNTNTKDYYIFPAIEFIEEQLTFKEVNFYQLDFYRYDSLEKFLELLRRKLI